MNRRYSHTLLFLFTCCGLAFPLLLTGCHEAISEQPSTEVSETGEIPTLNVSEAGYEVWPNVLKVQGSLLADERSIVGTELAGRVDKVLVDLGSIVLEGEPVVLLDDEEFALAVARAEAELKQACAAIGMSPSDSELELNRENSPPVRLERALLGEARASAERGAQLLERKVITESEYEDLVAQFQAAEARHQSALNRVGEQIALIGVKRSILAHEKQRLSEARVLAPFDGVVERRHVGPGEFLQLGSSVVTLVRTDILRFTAGVPERSASLVHEGQEIQVLVDGESAPLMAKITRVSPSVNQTNRSLAIQADMPNPGLRLRTGLFAEAEIIIDPQSESLTVPRSAVRQFAGIEKVWVVRDEVAKEVPIRVGRRAPHRVEVLEGVEPGDLVVVNSKQGQAGKVFAVIESDNESTRTAENGSLPKEESTNVSADAEIPASEPTATETNEETETGSGVAG